MSDFAFQPGEAPDPFRWLEDQGSVATRAFLAGEQERFASYQKKRRTVRSRVERRVAELLDVECVDLPYPGKNGDLFYLKRCVGAERKDLYRRATDGSEKRLLRAETFDLTAPASLAFVDLSLSGRYLVFGVRYGGEDVQQIRFYDLALSDLLPDKLPLGLLCGVAFSEDESGIYYSIEDSKGIYRSRHAVRFHLFKTNATSDEEIFHVNGVASPRLILRPSTDGSALGYLIASLEQSGMKFFVHAQRLGSAPIEVVTLEQGSFSPSFTCDEIEAVTTHLAPKGRVVRFAAAAPAPEDWKDILPSEEGLLRGYEAGAGFHIAHYWIDSITITKIFGADGTLLKTLHYPEGGTTVLGRFDPANLRIFYSHSDVGEPPSIYEMDIATGHSRGWWMAAKPKWNTVCSIQEKSCLSKDGTEIPVTVVRPSDAPVGPAIVSAYGANGRVDTPQFSVLTTVLLEEGFTCVTAHVRGGGKRGIEWHNAGMKTRKQASVDDLLAVADWIASSGTAEPDRLGIAGQSTGALLALCAMIQRPERFRAVVALGPIADLTRFHLFGVARGFVSELGSPENADESAALYALSPYHHVRDEARYPAVLLVSGDMDRRCDALHARKMTARLREVKNPIHPVLLDYNAIRGHKAVLPLAERIRALTDRLTFLIVELSQAENEVSS